MENIISFPDEVLISFLRYLSLPEVIHVLETNTEIRERLYPYFEEEIKKERENYLYPPDSLKTYETKIKRDIEIITHFLHHQEGYNRLCLLSPQLTKNMNLEHIPSYQGRAIYTPKLMRDWWELYIYTNRLISNGRIKVDNWMSSVLSLPFNQSLSFRDFSRHLGTQTQCSLSLHPTIEIIYALYQEESNLNEYLNYARYFKE